MIHTYACRDCIILSPDSNPYIQERVAIKRIRPTARDEFEARHTLREITIMRLCDRHPNVISLRGLSLNQSEDELYIIMELMFSDLYRIIKHVKPLNSGQVKVILKQILKGLEALHSIGIIHRDLKPVSHHPYIARPFSSF